jgi:hypothetical protein
MKQLPPPFVLVKTWLQLLRNAEGKDMLRHAKCMLVKAFGSVEIAVIYLEQQGFKGSAKVERVI